MNNINYPWTKKELQGTRDEVLTQLKRLANPNCNKCHGSGHIGYKFKKIKLKNGREIEIREYIPCHKAKCSNANAGPIYNKETIQ
jgi:hypothetical protein